MSNEEKHHIAYITASHLDLFWLGHLFSCLERGTDVNKQYIDDCLEHPERTYFIETAMFGAEFVKRHPEYEQKLKSLIDGGKLEIGAAFVDRIENSVSGESLIRNAVIGKRILRDTFGYDSEVCMHPDLPGYAPQMPQIYSKAGIKYYLTSRKIFPNGQVFRFRAPDGSTTLQCHFIFGYGFVTIHEIVEKIDEIGKGFPAGKMVAAGGGADLVGRDTFPAKYGAQLEDLIADGRAKHPSLEFSYVTLKEIMSDYEKLDVPVVSGEVPSNWGSKSSSNVEVWDTNRAAEAEVLDAELLGALASSFLGIDPVPSDRGDWFGWRYDTALGLWLEPETVKRGAEFEELWKLVLVPQDHNDASREGPETAFQKLQMHKRAREYAGAIKERCLEEIARRVKSRSGARTVVVFNQASWDRTDIVKREDIERPGISILDETGNEGPSQVAASSNGLDLWFCAADVPAVGYRSFYVENRPGKIETRAPACSESEDVIAVSTGDLRVEFNKQTGCIDRAEMTKTGLQPIPPAARGWGNIRAFTESSRDVDPKIDEKIPPENMKVESVTIASSGALFAEVVVKGRLCDSVLEQRWKVYSATPRIDLEASLLWWGKPRQQLRMELPFKEDFENITYETPFYANRWSEVMEGSGPWIGDEMSRHDWERYRELINWLDLSGDKGGVNIASRHAHYYIDRTYIQAVLLRSAVNCGDQRRYTTNAGRRVWRFSFTFHEGDWKTNAAYKRGFEFTRPLMHVSAENSASADLPESSSFLKIEPSNLVITAVKSPDRGNKQDMIVRFCEMEGKTCTAKLSVSGELKQAFETNLLEEDQGGLAVAPPGTVTAEVGPHQIRTWRLVK